MNLSKTLNLTSMKIKKDDTVLIISGKYRGKKGKVLRTFPKEKKILVEGVNLVKKHQKPRRTEEKGQIIELPKPIDISNAKLICPKCTKPTRVGYKIISNIKNLPRTEPKVLVRGQKSPKESLRLPTGQAKMRICKKCGEEI